MIDCHLTILTCALPPGSVAYHLQMAQLLDERDEPSAARGHRLRALVRKAEVPGDFR